MTQPTRGSSGPRDTNTTRKRSHSSANPTTVTPEAFSFINIRTHRNTVRLSSSSSKRKKQHQQSEQLQKIHSQAYQQNHVHIPDRMPSQPNVPAFLYKLYNMVEDPTTDQFVRWSNAGDTFLVQGHKEFAKQVLPRFYKHNTFTSFVRQLNMYDFHKIPHLQQGVLLNNMETEVWEFSNPHFQKGRPELLVLVTRKRSRDRDDADADRVNLGALIKEIGAIKKHQLDITADLKNLHRDNEIIWKETFAAREKHQKHQQVICKILQFLAAVFSNDQNALANLSNDMLEQQSSNQTWINQNRSGTATQLPDPLSKRNMKNYDSGIGSSDSVSGSNSGSDDDISMKPITFSQSPSVHPGINHEKAKAKLVSQSESCTPDNEELSYPEGSSSQASSSAFSIQTKIPNVSSRSAQAITNDIAKLQTNVESLAAQVGIDTTHFPEKSNDYFQSNHSDMIFTSSKSDRFRLFQLAGGNKLHQQHPTVFTSNGSEHHNHGTTSLEQASKQQQKPKAFGLSASSTTPEYSNIPFFFRHLLQSIDPAPALSNQSVPSSTIQSMNSANNMPHNTKATAQSSTYFSDGNAVPNPMQSSPEPISSSVIATKPFMCSQMQVDNNDGQCTTSAPLMDTATVYHSQSTAAFTNLADVGDMPDVRHHTTDHQEQCPTSLRHTQHTDHHFMAPPPSSPLAANQSVFFDVASTSMIPSIQHHSLYLPYHAAPNDDNLSFSQTTARTVLSSIPPPFVQSFHKETL